MGSHPVKVPENLRSFVRRRILDFGQDNFGNDTTGAQPIEKAKQPMDNLRPVAQAGAELSFPRHSSLSTVLPQSLVLKRLALHDLMN